MDHNFDNVDDADLQRLMEVGALERAVNPEKSGTELAEQILIDSAPYVAHKMVQLALNGSNESVRLRASMAILDRVLGKSGGDGPTKQAPWEGLIDAVSVPAAIEGKKK